MQALTKTRAINGFVNLSIQVPEKIAKEVEATIKEALDEYRAFMPKEVMGPTTSGDLIRGARYREGLTQVNMAKLLGVSKSYLSDLEHDRRPVSKKMARDLGALLNVNWKIFL
jgi:DNA-binding XRE family transcriptional regulator